MTEELRDLDREPWEIVEETDDGGAIRNDGTKLKPMRKNPWYVLATPYGEQEGGILYEELAAKNRRAWNLWSCQKLDPERRADLARRMGLEAAELGGDWEMELEEIEQLFLERLGPHGVLPNPSDGVDLSGTYLPNYSIVSFGRYVFSEYANLRSATFSGAASFISATFSGPADYRFATFSGPADFRSATFSGPAHFQSATFSGPADFLFASFSGPAHFRSATFSGPADFQSATFSGRARFVESKFKEAALFRDCLFETPASFRRARFESRFPIFEGTILHETTYFSANKAHWPKNSENEPEEGKEAAATIRHVVGKQSRVDDEHFFFRKEMAFVRRGGGFQAWLVRFYWLVSDYGHGVLRPLLFLIATVAGFAVYLTDKMTEDCFVLGTAPSDTCKADWIAEFPVMLGLSFSNVFAFLGFHRRFFNESPFTDAEFGEALPWVVFLSGAETVLGFIFLFFLGLGLRNRFRLK